MANKWIAIECAFKEALVVAPAELALAWPGGRSTGETDVYLTYWQHHMKALKKAHPELAWQGNKDSPFVRVKSEAEAKSVIDKLTAVLETKFPALKTKKQKEIMQYRYGDGFSLSTQVPVAASEALIEEGKGKDVWIAKGVLLWRVTVNYDVRARITDDGLLLVDSEADDDELDGMIKGKATSHGKWKLASGIAVVHWAGTSVAECKGLESGKLSAIAAVIAKKPAAPLKVKDSDAGGGAAAFKLAPGTYRIETGGDKKARWLRMVR